jgi:general secretion pathway protein N
VRVEDVAPRTWVLATIAGWALLLWVLALAGMGGRIDHLADDPAMQQKLPQLPPPPAERLGPLAQYAEIGARPLFSENRQPQPFSLTAEGGENAAPAFDFILTSVLLTPTLREAIVQPSAGGESVRIKLGEAAESQPAWRLTALNPRSAVFEGPEGQKTLDLRVFDGTGGEPPTTVQAGAPGGAQDSAAVQPAGQPRTGARQPTRTPTPTPTQAPPPADATAPEPDAGADTEADTDQTPNEEAQVESIRKRIEERRAQLRQQAQTPPAPVKNP